MATVVTSQVVQAAGQVTGLGAIQEARAAERGGGGEFINELRLLQLGDIAKIRIVTEHDEAYSAYFYRHQTKSKKGTLYWTNTLATEGMEEDPQWADVKRTRHTLLWVYVYAIYHKAPSQDPNVVWEKGQLGAMTVYKEPVDEFQILRANYFDEQVLVSQVERQGSLTSRDYERTRQGMGTETRYTLDALDPRPLKPEIAERVADLPSLEDIASKRVTKWGEDPNAPAPAFQEVVMAPPVAVEDMPF